MRTNRKIAILVEGRGAYERSVLLGIREFAGGRPDWLMRLERPGRRLSRFLREWQPDGVLFQVDRLSPAARKAVLDLDCPTVHVSDTRRNVNAPCVGLDNAEIGRLAAGYLRERGLAHFAFVGLRGAEYSRSRQASFVAGLEAEGHRVHSRELPREFAQLNAAAEDRVRAWLRRLPRPAGLFAVHDECSLLIATLCREEGIRVPDDLAILGSDDDALICELASPRLSSIAVPAERVGWAAAEQLAAAMDGSRSVRRSRRRDSAALLLPPLRVVARQSTDVVATGDEQVTAVLRHIAAEFQRRINVDDILRATGTSRRALERKFREHLGRSPLQELHRQRVAHARQLLLTGKEALHRIAPACGFADASQFVNVFRKQTGMTPGEFRRRAQPAGA